MVLVQVFVVLGVVLVVIEVAQRATATTTKKTTPRTKKTCTRTTRTTPELVIRGGGTIIEGIRVRFLSRIFFFILFTSILTISWVLGGSWPRNSDSTQNFIARTGWKCPGGVRNPPKRQSFGFLGTRNGLLKWSVL